MTFPVLSRRSSIFQLSSRSSFPFGSGIVRLLHSVAGEGPARDLPAGVEAGPGLEPERAGGEAQRRGAVGVRRDRHQVEPGRLQRQLARAGEGADGSLQRRGAVGGPAKGGGQRAGHRRVRPQPGQRQLQVGEREAYRPRGQPVLGLDGQPLDCHRRHRPPPRGRGGRRGGRPGGQLQHVEHGQVAVGLTPGEEAPAAHLDLVHRGGPPQQVHVDPAHLDARELHGTGRVPAARQPEVLQQQPQPARLEEPPRGPQLQGVAGLDRGGALLDQQRRRRFDLVRTVLGELQPLEGDGAGGADRVGVDRPPPLEGLARLGAAAQRVRADGVAGGPEVVEPDGERPELRLEPGRAGGVGEGHPGLDHIEQVERHPQPARLRLAGNGRRRWRSAVAVEQVLHVEPALGVDGGPEEGAGEPHLGHAPESLEQPPGRQPHVQPLPGEEPRRVPVGDQQPVHVDGEREGVDPDLRDRDAAVEPRAAFLLQRVSQQLGRHQEAEPAVAAASAAITAAVLLRRRRHRGGGARGADGGTSSMRTLVRQPRGGGQTPYETCRPPPLRGGSAAPRCASASAPRSPARPAPRSRPGRRPPRAANRAAPDPRPAP